MIKHHKSPIDLHWRNVQMSQDFSNFFKLSSLNSHPNSQNLAVCNFWNFFKLSKLFQTVLSGFLKQTPRFVLTNFFQMQYSISLLAPLTRLPDSHSCASDKTKQAFNATHWTFYFKVIRVSEEITTVTQIGLNINVNISHWILPSSTDQNSYAH